MTAGDRRQAYLRIWDVTVHDGGEGEHRSEDWELGVPLQKPSDEAQKVTLIKRRGRVVGLSHIQDYLYCAPELKHVNLYEWIRCYKEKNCLKI